MIPYFEIGSVYVVGDLKARPGRLFTTIDSFSKGVRHEQKPGTIFTIIDHWKRKTTIDNDYIDDNSLLSVAKVLIGEEILFLPYFEWSMVGANLISYFPKFC